MTLSGCWMATAAALFSQALAGEPELAEALPTPMEGRRPAFAAEIGGEVEGRFTVVLDLG